MERSDVLENGATATPSIGDAGVASASSTQHIGFSGAYKAYALATLSAVYMLNLVDRGLMSLLLQPIKEDLQLSDTQLGFVTGIAFGLFYATLGLPIARAADRGNRVTITSLAIGLWGLTVMACLFVHNYAQLVLARVLAAVGESGCKPPTYSLIGDYFPQPRDRTRAMAVYMAGSLLSSIVSYVIGGELSERYGWRMTFFLMGIPGLLLALIVKISIREPRKTVVDDNRRRPPAASVRTVFITLWTCKSLRHVSIALVLLYMLGLGLSPWYAAFMMRSHGMGTAELGRWLGLIFAFGGVAGVLLGGYVASRWFAANERGQMRLAAITVALVTPFFLTFLLAPQKWQAVLALIPFYMAFTFFMGPTYALMQRLVCDEMRATVLAVVMLVANLLGMGVGPQVVGILSDLFAPALGQQSLRYALVVTAFVAVWAAWHFWRAGLTVQEDLAAVARAPGMRSHV